MSSQTLSQDPEASVEVDLERLGHPCWTLRLIDDRTVSELARSIESTGLLQPIVVRRYNGGYEIVFGNHRVEACRRLGWKSIKAIVRSFNDDEAFLARVTENLVRNINVDPIEEAEGYKSLLDSGWSINGIARRIGKCDSYVCERVRLLDNLTANVRSKITHRKGHLSPSHAELLSRIRDPVKQSEIAELVEKKRLSVRSTEDLLNGVPLPRRIQVSDHVPEECCIQVPVEFAQVAKILPGEMLYMYIRGSKLIVENVNRPRRRMEARVSGN